MVIKQTILPTRILWGSSTRSSEGTLVGFHQGHWIPADVVKGIPAERLLVTVGNPNDVCNAALGCVYVEDNLKPGQELWLGTDGKIVFSPTTGCTNQRIGRIDSDSLATVFLG